MISGRKYQGLSGFRLFTRRVKSVKQAKFRLSDIQSVYLKKTAQFRYCSVKFEIMGYRIFSKKSGFSVQLKSQIQS